MSKVRFGDRFESTFAKFEKTLKFAGSTETRVLTLKEQIELENERAYNRAVEKRESVKEKDRFIQVSPHFEHEL